MRWVLRLVETGAEGEARCTDIMEIIRPDDLGDIADLGLTLAEAKLLQARVQQESLPRKPGAMPSGGRIVGLAAERAIEGLSGPSDRDAFWPGDGAPSPVSVRRV